MQVDYKRNLFNCHGSGHIDNELLVRLFFTRHEPSPFTDWHSQPRETTAFKNTFIKLKAVTYTYSA